MSGSTYAGVKQAETRTQIPLDILAWGKGVNNNFVIEPNCVVVDNFPAKAAIKSYLTDHRYVQILRYSDAYFGTTSQVWKRKG
jgi:hypothetical protein